MYLTTLENNLQLIPTLDRIFEMVTNGSYKKWKLRGNQPHHNYLLESIDEDSLNPSYLRPFLSLFQLCISFMVDT
jgi:hypothetical protein